MIDVAAAKQVTNAYTAFIEEAFIAPIRTAVVLDDEYPTLDEFLIEKNTSGEAEWAEEGKLDAAKRNNRGRVRKILDFCRSRSPIPWLVDVHNGIAPSLASDASAVQLLDHSDLLILDYHLEPEGTGNRKSIDILRRLASTGHLNLVVVYTKDREGAGNGVNRAVTEIAMSLACPDKDLALHEKQIENIETRLEEWQNEINSRTLYRDLLGCLDETAFLRILGEDDRSWSALRRLPEVNSLERYLDNIPQDVSLKPDQVLDYLLHKKQDEYKTQMSEAQYGRVSIGKKSDDINWIRTDSLFVTVVSKEHDASEIPTRLLKALEAWDPPPHRLIMSKMRSELGRNGAGAEAIILKNMHLQAGWLDELLESNDAIRCTNVRSNVRRHWETLGAMIEPDVVEFADRVAGYLSASGEGAKARFDQKGAYDDQAEIHMQLNSYACSKPVEGHSLATGHVLWVRRDKKANPEYWLCLTPACDLVAGQGDEKGWKKRLGSWLPFKAVRLYEEEDSKGPLMEAARGHHVFLNLNGKVCAFALRKAEGNDNGQEMPTMLWEQFFAGGQGAFDHSKRELTVARIGDQSTLKYVEYEAVVVAQLRYEYALNLMNKLGTHLSRVGLDFKSYSSSQV